MSSSGGERLFASALLSPGLYLIEKWNCEERDTDNT